MADVSTFQHRGTPVTPLLPLRPPVYGELRAERRIESRADVAAWAEATRRSGAHLLSELTDGVHLHTLEAPSAERLERARTVLREHGFLLAAG